MDYLFVTPSFIPFVGGAQNFQRAMARRLVADGHRVTVLTTAARQPADFWRPPTLGAPELASRVTLDGVEVERLALAYPRPAPHAFGILRRAGHWIHRLGLPSAVQRPLLDVLARWMPPLPGLASALTRLVPGVDLVQAADSSWDGLFTVTASSARLHRKPFVAVPLMHLGAPSVTAHFQMAHQVDTYRRADAVVAISRREATVYQSLGVLPETVHVLAMGIDAETPQSLPSTARFRDQHGLQGPVVAFVGANTYDKGAFTLALSVAQLNSSGLRVDLVCAGPESERLAVYLREQPIRVQAALKDRVHLLGIVDESTKHALLDACALLALPSQVDTFGMVLLEAWLHGKPVIGASAGGIPDLIRPEVTGLLVPFGNIDALADAIRRLLGEPGQAARLGAAGRRQVLEQYTWEATYRKELEIYRKALEHAATPSG